MSIFTVIVSGILGGNTDLVTEYEGVAMRPEDFLEMTVGERRAATVEIVEHVDFESVGVDGAAKVLCAVMHRTYGHLHDSSEDIAGSEATRMSALLGMSYIRRVCRSLRRFAGVETEIV